MSRSKIIFIELTRYLFLFLFLYTAYAKLVEHDKFERVLEKSPFIGSTYASLISWFVPISELLISITLVVPKTKIKALYPAVALMLIFTSYLSTMLLSGKKHPCLCGGVISELTWEQHILFNLAFIFMGLIAIWLYQDNSRRLKKRTALQLASSN